MNWKLEAEELAKKEYPREACGLVIIRKGREVFFPCTNISEDIHNFIISGEQYAEAEDTGEVVGIFHSHCNKSPHPSVADLTSCEKTNKKWYIFGVPSHTWNEFEPKGFAPPLIGREFTHGVLDCYALVRDWYKVEMNLDLPDFVREDGWWIKGQNLYLDNFAKAGFVETDKLEYGVGLLMQINSPVVNHAAVYIGENQIIHHMFNRLSSRDVYGGMYRKNTIKMVKYAKRD